MNFRLKSQEALYILNQSGAKILFFEERYTSVFEPILKELKYVTAFYCTEGSVPSWATDYEKSLAENSTDDPPLTKIELDDVCAICYTSGTTGLPKGSIATHRNIMVNFYSDEFGRRIKRPDPI